MSTMIVVTKVNREAIINTTATMRYGGRTLFSVTINGGVGVAYVTATDTVEEYRTPGIFEVYSGLGIVEV